MLRTDGIDAVQNATRKNRILDRSGGREPRGHV
jgi:hypothetical protein